MHGALPDGHCLFYLRRNELTMTREEIEKAANDRYSDNTFAYKGFIAGAQWRINSVWHDLPNDLPQKENTWILLELIFEGRLVYLPVEWVNDGEGAPKQAIRWAYIDDLLPERKEETE